MTARDVDGEVVRRLVSGRHVSSRPTPAELRAAVAVLDGPQHRLSAAEIAERIGRCKRQVVRYRAMNRGAGHA